MAVSKMESCAGDVLCRAPFREGVFDAIAGMRTSSWDEENEGIKTLTGSSYVVSPMNQLRGTSDKPDGEG